MTEGGSVLVELADGTTQPLSLEAVYAAAGSIGPSATDDESRTVAMLNEQPFDALLLVARALDVGPDLIRPRRALQALQILKVPVDAGNVPIPEEKAKPKPYEELEPEPVADVSLDVTPELAVQLQRKRGRWVAIHNDKVAAEADSLGSLLRAVGDMTATVLYVPRKDEID